MTTPHKPRKRSSPCDGQSQNDRNGSSSPEPLQVRQLVDDAVWAHIECLPLSLSYEELAASCVEQFGPERAPTADAIRRLWLRRHPVKAGGKRTWWRLDPEVALFVDGRIGRLTVTEIRTLIAERFGASRVPARSALHRYMQLAARRFGPTKATDILASRGPLRMVGKDHALYLATRAAFVATGSSLAQWCRKHGVPAKSARVALRFENDGPRSGELRRRIVAAVGLVPDSARRPAESPETAGS